MHSENSVRTSKPLEVAIYPTQPKPYPKEFRDDVVAVARQGQAPADIEDGNRPGLTESERVELGELKKRNRLLEQGKRGLTQGSRLPVTGELAGKIAFPIVLELAVACQVLFGSTQGYCKWLKQSVSQRD